MGSSSIYKITSVENLPDKELCYKFAYDPVSKSYVDSSMQAITQGGMNQLILEANGVEIVDGQIIKDNVFVLLKYKWPDKMNLTMIIENDLTTVKSFEYQHKENPLSIGGTITAEGKVYIRQSLWGYDRLKDGKRYENEIVVFDLVTNELKQITIAR